MDLLGHGRHKFPKAQLIASSRALGWTGIAAEVRAHPAGDIAAIQPDQVEVTVALAGDAGAIVCRKGAGVRQATPVVPGQIWISPVGLVEDDIRITRPLSRILHLYLPTAPDPELSHAFGGRTFRGDSLRYLAGVQDPLIQQIGPALAAEMTHESAGGKVLADALANALTARLLQAYATGRAVAVAPSQARVRLDDPRVQRAIDFMTAHLEDDIGLAEIAAAAALSPFHFSRVFKAATGAPPHRYLGRLRLDAAKRMLADGHLPLAEISAACRFSTQANFTRAFRQSTGLTPGAYRAQRRSG